MQEKLVETSENNEPLEKELIHSPLEALIHKVNGQGRYQIYSFFIFAFMWFLTSWLLLGMGFFFDSSYTCTDPQYTQEDLCIAHICKLTPADRHKEISWHASSIVFQFDNYLICPDQENTVSVLQSMLFVGAIFGFFVIPYIADNYGRRLGIRVAWAIGTLAVLITCLADSPNMVGLGLFLIGFGTNPAITLCFSFINEVCLGRYRQRFGVGVQVAFAIGETTVALVFQLDLTWKEIMYILLAMFIAGMALIIFFIDETPMFVIKKNPQAALDILNRMARINKKRPLILHQVTSIKNEEETDEILPEQKSLGVFDLFKYKSIRWTSISAAMILFGVQAIYYSSQLNSSSVGFEKTINQIIFGVSETIGYLSAELFIDKCLRRKATFIGLGISAGMCLILGLLVQFQNESNEEVFRWLETAGLMINRFVLCSFWSIFFVYVAELYPTEVRSLGFGWTSVVGMLGSTVSPFVKQIAELAHLNSWFPPALFGIIGWIFALCLPQTLGLPLKDVIQQRVETLKKEKSRMDIQDAQDDQDDDFDNETVRATSIDEQIEKDRDFNIQN